MLHELKEISVQTIQTNTEEVAIQTESEDDSMLASDPKEDEALYATRGDIMEEFDGPEEKRRHVCTLFVY